MPHAGRNRAAATRMAAAPCCPGALAGTPGCAQRVCVALPGSSAAGGVALSRHVWGWRGCRRARTLVAAVGCAAVGTHRCCCAPWEAYRCDLLRGPAHGGRRHDGWVGSPGRHHDDAVRGRGRPLRWVAERAAALAEPTGMQLPTAAAMMTPFAAEDVLSGGWQSVRRPWPSPRACSSLRQPQEHNFHLREQSTETANMSIM